MHNFAGKDGANPTYLIRDAGGNLYGITIFGGDLNCPEGKGCGTVFRLDPAGRETVIHSFTQSVTDGGVPTGLIMDAKGNLYGTTELGGAQNVGTVFKIDKSGKETVLYSFTGANGGPDGASPLGGVILDASGNLYGSTAYGGLGNTGTVFKIDAAGKETVLYRFTGGNNGSTDGKNPMGGLVMDAAGNLYGTTSIGGTNGAGTIFKVDPHENETALHSFAGSADGSYPQSPLSRDAVGNLYGNADGGTNGVGAVFKYDTAGNESLLHSFSGPDGEYPGGALFLNSTSTGVVIYGTTQQGGASGWGTVFEIVP